MTAQLTTVDIVSPGYYGLNREARARLLPGEFATKLTNFRVNKEGLLSSRLGQLDQTTTAITATPNVESLHEYVDSSGNVEMILAWDGGISNDIDNPEGSDVSGSLTDTNGTWLFKNFNGKCLAFQSGQKLAVYTGSTFATVVESGGTAPTTGIAGSAFGRVWQVDEADGSNIKYTGLLDETDWNGSGSGSIDLSNVWIDGEDNVTAIVGFNGSLVIFGLNHIVFIVDGSGSEIGLNPANAYVADVISGTGCVDQHTVQAVGETEMIFLSAHGLQSLSRVIQEKSNPTETVSRAITTDLLTSYRAATAGTIRSAYSDEHGLYIISFAGDVTYALDIRRPYSAATSNTKLYPVYEWDLIPTSWAARLDGSLMMGGAGNIYKYSGTTDDGTNIQLHYESPWLELGEEFANRLKILKRIGAIIFTSLNGNVVYKWATDFRTNFNSYTKDFVAPSGGSAEWGVSEWNIGEWSGALSIQITRVPARDKGQYFKVGISASVDKSFSLQQVELLAKLGRIA